jgi:hypothetical protein
VSEWPVTHRRGERASLPEDGTVVSAIRVAGIDQDPMQLLGQLGISQTAAGLVLDPNAPAAELRLKLTQPSPRACIR